MRLPDENTDNDHFFCTPDPADLANVFRAAAVALAGAPGSSSSTRSRSCRVVSPGAAARRPAADGHITGLYFTEAYSVTFGGSPAQSFTVVSDSSITAVSPAGTAGATVDVQVSTPGGSSKIVAVDNYTYASP